MFVIREKYCKYTYLIAVILIQLISSNCEAGKIKCLQCKGANCTEKVEPTDCVNETFKYCFTKIDGQGFTERGCLKEEELKSCIPANGCAHTEDGKNNQLICKKCDGSDENCSKANMNNKKYNEICDGDVKKCFTKLENKLVVRGCGTDTLVTQCNDTKICTTCETDICNTEVFPPDRIKCYHCSGSSCNYVNANNITSEACHIFEENDECYTSGNTKGNITRGCKSDPKDNKCSTNVEGCTFCNNTDCNNAAYEFTCIVCRSDEDRRCWNDAHEIQGRKCRTQNNSTEVEGCGQGIWNDVAIRGCIADFSIQYQLLCKNENNPNKCSICHSKDCNTQKSSGPKIGFSYSLILTVLLTLWKFN